MVRFFGGSKFLRCMVMYNVVEGQKNHRIGQNFKKTCKVKTFWCFNFIPKMNNIIYRPWNFYAPASQGIKTTLNDKQQSHAHKHNRTNSSKTSKIYNFDFYSKKNNLKGIEKCRNMIAFCSQSATFDKFCSFSSSTSSGQSFVFFLNGEIQMKMKTYFYDCREHLTQIFEITFMTISKLTTFCTFCGCNIWTRLPIFTIHTGMATSYEIWMLINYIIYYQE